VAAGLIVLALQRFGELFKGGQTQTYAFTIIAPVMFPHYYQPDDNATDLGAGLYSSGDSIRVVCITHPIGHPDAAWLELTDKSFVPAEYATPAFGTRPQVPFC
jgi:hypothetical protein